MEIIFEFFYEVIFYTIGWCVCRIFTLGQYPKGTLLTNESDKEWSVFLIAILGMIISFFVVYTIHKLTMA